MAFAEAPVELLPTTGLLIGEQRLDDTMRCYTAQGYDMGNAVAHGIARAKTHEPRRCPDWPRERTARPGNGGRSDNVINFGPMTTAATRATT
jgi:hypothetical protein